jgi:alkanesulfonate monooxygenase SsuD/methylene tetrahydromethanopterin reductase-like flavin-dependent oxidoreductase (luciferase family)
MAENLDRFSGGRLILGLGGGGADDKMRSAGITPPAAPEKITSLAEAAAIVTGMWSTPGFTATGRHWSVDGIDLAPKPARPIPLWLGVLGLRGARLAGRIADGWIPHVRYVPWDRLDEGRRALAIGAERAGRDPAALTCIASVEVHVGDLPDAPRNAITGPPETVAEGLATLVGLGFDGFNISPLGPDRPEQPTRIAEEVLPLLATVRPGSADHLLTVEQASR